MTTEETFLFDTYALIEILESNKNYEIYKKKRMIINDFILAEFSYRLLRENVPGAIDYINLSSQHILHASPETIRKAMAFRYENKKKKLSMTDCISYFQAKELGIKFLTGDKEFEKLEGVEFVK